MTTPEFGSDPSQLPEQFPETSVVPESTIESIGLSSYGSSSRSQSLGDRPSSDRQDYEQGERLIESGNYKDALTALNRAVTLHAHDHLAWTLRGVVLVCLGQYDAAIASCDRALMIQPDHSEAWKFRGLALHGLNRYREAYKSYDRALGIERRSPLEATIHWVRQHLCKTDEVRWQPPDALLG